MELPVVEQTITLVIFRQKIAKNTVNPCFNSMNAAQLQFITPDLSPHERSGKYIGSNHSLLKCSWRFNFFQPFNMQIRLSCDPVAESTLAEAIDESPSPLKVVPE